jgi:Flp pilus assembly secretin CpaC
MGIAMALRRFTLLLTVSLAVIPAVVFAVGPITVEAVIDEATLVRLDTTPAQLIVGNPAIADVTSMGGRILVVTGKSYGTTNFIALDAAGREILNARVSVANGNAQVVRVYKGTAQMSLHCSPECQRTLTIGDDKTQFEPLAEVMSKKFGVVNSATGTGN